MISEMERKNHSYVWESSTWGSHNKLVVWVLSFSAVLFFSLGPHPAWAGEMSLSDIFSLTWPEDTKLPDRLMIRGGYGYVFGANTTIQANGPAGIGTELDFDRDLGGETTGSLGRADMLFRFNSRHAAGFTWYKLNRDGLVSNQTSFNWDGLTYRAGGSVQTTLNIELYRFWYMWSFYRGESLELAFSPGVYLARLQTSLAGTLTVADSAGAMATATARTKGQDLTLPLPSLGLIGNYAIDSPINCQCARGRLLPKG